MGGKEGSGEVVLPSQVGRLPLPVFFSRGQDTLPRQEGLTVRLAGR